MPEETSKWPEEEEEQEEENMDVTEQSFARDIGLIIVWDPEILPHEDYVELVQAFADVVRAHGGLGVELVRPDTFGITVEEGVPQ